MAQNPKNRKIGSSPVSAQPSMGTLILWNISKAMAENSQIDLKSALAATQERINQDTCDLNAMVAGSPQEQHLACALLAWEQLGHSEADSLFDFVEKKKKDRIITQKANSARLANQIEKKDVPLSPGSFISYEDSFSKGLDSPHSEYSAGPVVKLPVDTKIVMRVENTPSKREPKKKTPESNIMNKIDAACCMESACMERLSKLDKSTKELRMRAERLARREAERVELLERAEAAWKDLEIGYQRRLDGAEEKEADMAKQIKKMIEERNNYKNACTALAQQLRERGEAAERDRAILTDVEKQVCETACMRLRLSEESARFDATLADQQCKAAQLDRDLQFKEEQSQRKLINLQSEVESARVLTCEIERALRSELGAVRDQIADVSKQLLHDDDETNALQAEIEELRQEKNEIVEDLDGCQVLCDGRIGNKMTELKAKKEQLAELRERVMECKCKLPLDASVEVKRTPSLAAMCRCTPEDKFLEACSCTSLRTALMSNLLSDLFGGLQSELEGCVAKMPCQLLKCLEDKHNWDRSSVIKTNLRNFFSQLLTGELDIAVATAIEKYHARWVGASCADACRPIPDRGGPENEGWQERAIERKAQMLATKLAEQLFQDRADQLTAKAKEVMRTGPPPCECKPECKPKSAAVYPVLVKPPVIRGGHTSLSSVSATAAGATTPAYWRRTHHDVTQLKEQLENLKKDSIKKEDLKIMEKNIVKMVQRSVPEKSDRGSQDKEKDCKKYKECSVHRYINTDQIFKSNKLLSLQKKRNETNCPKKANKNIALNLQVSTCRVKSRTYKNLAQSYAVNLCLCKTQKDPKKTNQTVKPSQEVAQDSESKKQYKPLALKEIVSKTSNIRQSKPIASQISSAETFFQNNSITNPFCSSDVVCFHKKPSNTSIDKLLETLAKWKCDLAGPDGKQNKCMQKYKQDVKVTDELQNFKKATDKNVDIRDSTKIVQKMSTETSSPKTMTKQILQVSRSTDINDGLPLDTESEYMAAINLDKSNENFTDKSRKTNKQNAIVPFPCKHSKLCNCKQSIDKTKNVTKIALHLAKKKQQQEKFRFNKNVINQRNPVIQGNVANQRNLEKQYKLLNQNNLADIRNFGEQSNLAHQGTVADQSNLEKQRSFENQRISDYRNELNSDYRNEYNSDYINHRNSDSEKQRNVLIKQNILKSNQLEANTNSVTKPVTPFPSDCECCINFLGVTLTNANLEIDRKIKDKTNSKNYNPNRRKMKQSQNHKNIVGDVPTPTSARNDDQYNNKINNLNSSCDCDSYHELRKSQINGKIHKNLFNDELRKIPLNQELRKSPINDELREQLLNDGLQKSPLNNELSKQRGDFLKSADKSLDTQSLNDKDQSESCVCCDNCKINDEKEESKELEVNTFHLLEEHLRDKLEEFKMSTCKQSCITPQYEKILFSTILQKIKQVISDSTNDILCKCNDNEPTTGSWKRANTLLHEYLKIKIKRVQCVCFPSENKSDEILDTIMEKVSNLIDSDFQRLKDSCKCLNADIQALNYDKTVKNQIEIPEKDNNTDYQVKSKHASQKDSSKYEKVSKDFSNKSLKDSNKDEKVSNKVSNKSFHNSNKDEKVSKEVSNKSLIQTQSISAQISPLVGMETKSCDPIEKTNDVCELNKCCKISEINYEGSICPEKVNNPRVEFATRDVLVNQCLNVVNKTLSIPQINTIENMNLINHTINENFQFNNNVDKSEFPAIDKNIGFNKISSPYVGFTLECLCNERLGTCRCTKSIIADNINSIWNTLTSNKLHNNDVSYIMNAAVPKVLNEIIDDPDATDDDIKYDKPKKNDQQFSSCYTNTSLREKEITLKDSKTKQFKTFVSTTTSDDNASYGTDEPIDWCDCPNIKHKFRKSSDFNVNPYDESLYYPIQNLKNQGKSEAVLKSDQKSMPGFIASACECNMVPLCHVKMLVKQIEKKLINNKCTCDSLSSQVCPIHSESN